MMGIAEKIANAKKTNWITEGLSKEEVKTTIELAKISASIEQKRIEMGMTQKEFAKYMGVTQSMVSKWESREYNFTIKSLNEVCEKLKLNCVISVNKPCSKSDYKLLKWDKEKGQKRKKKNWINNDLNKWGNIA